MTSHDEPILLWSLQVHGRDVRCLQQAGAHGFELRIVLGDEVFLSETFRDRAQLVARAEEFRSTLESRGLERLPHEPPSRSGKPGDTGDAAPHRGAGPGSGDSHGEAAGSADAPLGSAHLPTVLVVDDEGAVRSFLRAYLEEAGYEVCEATDVDGALSVLDQTHVDAVVLDVRMPDPRGLGRTGLEVLAFIRLQATSATLPVLILTGRLLEPEEQDLIRRHRAHLFLKPDGYRKLLQRLDQLTGRRETRRP
jgi:CheY-like chemotaxis protein